MRENESEKNAERREESRVSVTTLTSVYITKRNIWVEDVLQKSWNSMSIFNLESHTLLGFVNRLKTLQTNSSSLPKSNRFISLVYI